MIDELEIHPAPDEHELETMAPERLPPVEETEGVLRSEFRPYLDDPE